MSTPKEKRDIYWKRRNAGLCVRCGGEPIPLRTMCFKCREMDRWRGKVYYRIHRKERIRTSRENRKKRVKEHRCMRCGVDLPEEHKGKSCVNCMNRELAEIRGITKDRRHSGRYRPTLENRRKRDATNSESSSIRALR